MFNSPKIGNSPSVDRISLHKTMNETANGIPRSFLQPKITSTPLARRDSIFATPPKPHPLSPRRYSLSEIATPPRTNKRDLIKIHTTGPLLTSTKYNVNVSTYEDTKSPGLASRIVQYNEEAERERECQRTLTHQAKYGSPGLFPVVHLFKKKLPILEQKPRRVTIRIASPEYLRQHPQEYNRKLLEGIIKPNSLSNSRHLLASQSSEVNNSSTRSVLDALKEISRKRIHTNEEYELNEDTGKRIRTESVSDTDTNKRLRDESPVMNNSSSPNKTGPKRICMYDEYSASCSSMNFLLKKPDQPVQKRKSISISTLTENPKEFKQVKLINVETQTVIDDDDKKNTHINKVTSGTEENQIKKQTSDDKPVKKKESPIKIFDDAPLERIRKNRLAALMGSLAGKDPVLAPKPDFVTALNPRLEKSETPETTSVEVSTAIDKPLVSILSSPKKDSPSRHNKHVHFSLPESISQTITTPSIMSFSITQSSAAITSPISSTCEVKSSFTPNKNEKLETPAPPSSPVGLIPNSSDMITAVPPVVFGTESISSSATSVVSKGSSASLLSADASKSIPNFQFKSPTRSSIVLGDVSSTMSFTASSPVPSLITFGGAAASAPSSTVSPPKVGGFKFDLSKSAATPSAVTTSGTTTFSFGVASESKLLFKPTTTAAAAPSSTNSSGSTLGFSFGTKSTSSASSASTTTAGSFSTSTDFNTSSSNTANIPNFKFGSANVDNKPAGSGFGLMTTSLVSFGSASAPTSTFSFGAKTSTAPPVSVAPTVAVPAFGTSKSPIFSFGTASSTSKASNFSAVTTTSASLTFGTPSTTASGGFGVTPSSGFGAPSSGFGVPPSSFGPPSSGFGGTAASLTVSSFGAPSTTSGGFGATTSGGFGTTTSGSFSTTTSGGFGTTTTPMFGDNKAVSPFGITTSTSSGFGTSSMSSSPPFGKNSTSAYGRGTTQPSFEIPTTAVSFGTVNAFGGTTTTTSSVFGGPTSSAGYGKSSNTASIFGGVANTQASSFGATNSKPIFGAAMTSPFGSSTPTTTTAFGSGTTPTFNFGAKTTASGTFGTSNVFGTTTTTTNTGFGTSTTPAFGTSNVFGSGSPSFGTSNAFGSSTPSAFGAVTTTTQSTGFGATNTASAFGSPSTSFGANNKSSVFLNSSTPAFGSNSTPSYGASVPTTGFGITNNTSGFGTNTGSAFAKSQTAFGSTPNAFGATTNFGANQPQASGFGSTNPPSTQTPVFSFGATAAPKSAGVFSFGASSSGEPLKPTFNFTGGSPAPSFGSAGTPSFGSTGTPSFGIAGVPQFNPPQPATTGMFSIGSGSSSGRTRTQLKAKRRI